MNVTLTVATMLDCGSLEQYRGTAQSHDPTWKQTLAGCTIIDILRDMYNFSVSYVRHEIGIATVIDGAMNMSHAQKGRINAVDMYTRPIIFRKELLDVAYPIHAYYPWRFGFVLRRPEAKFFTSFYSKPFVRPVWNLLYGMALFVSILFYLLKRWEFDILGGWECSFAYELLMVIGAYCQHIPPMDPKLASRRIAYFIFFMFAYIVYTFYTSNLLSNLVNDTDHGIALETLADSNYECVIVDYVKMFVSGTINNYDQKIRAIFNQLLTLRTVSVADGIEEMRTGQVALLSDYITIYPYIRKVYDNAEICKLIRIDLFSKTKKYFVTSKKFLYKEQVKIGVLRMSEAGLIKRLVVINFDVPHCSDAHHVQTSLVYISAPLTILLSTYITSVLILLGEIIMYRKNKVWPYVN